MAGFLNNRHYLAGYGIFTSVDPIMIPGDPATLNAYVYSRGSPITISDPSGLIGVCPDGRVFGGSRYTAAAQAACDVPEGGDPDVTEGASPPEAGGPPLPHYNPAPEDPIVVEASDAAAEMANSDTPPDSWLWMTANQCLYQTGRRCASHIDGIPGTLILIGGATGVVVITYVSGPLGGYRAFRYLRQRYSSPTPAAGPSTDSPISRLISRQRQMRHIRSSPSYNNGGYLQNLDDAQQVLDSFHNGTAQILGVTRSGNVVVRVPTVTGYNNNPGRMFFNQRTNVFMIKGTVSPSVVPMSPAWQPPINLPPNVAP